MTVESKSEQDTYNAGAEFAKSLHGGEVVAFRGELGAGKTAFIRGMCSGLNIKSRVSSPTFTIVNEYVGKIPLFHFDMYRLSSSDELFDIGWEDYLERGGICAVEWSENVQDAFDSNTIYITIEKTGENSRVITIQKAES